MLATYIELIAIATILYICAVHHCAAIPMHVRIDHASIYMAAPRSISSDGCAHTCIYQ